MNDGIPEHLYSLWYTSIDQAIATVYRCGRGAWMAKADIKSAFLFLLVQPDNFMLLGFAFEGQYFMDRARPMGCSISCAALEHFCSFLNWSFWNGPWLP